MKHIFTKRMFHSGSCTPGNVFGRHSPQGKTMRDFPPNPWKFDLKSISQNLRRSHLGVLAIPCDMCFSFQDPLGGSQVRDVDFLKPLGLKKLDGWSTYCKYGPKSVVFLGTPTLFHLVLLRADKTYTSAWACWTCWVCRDLEGMNSHCRIF